MHFNQEALQIFNHLENSRLLKNTQNALDDHYDSYTYKYKYKADVSSIDFNGTKSIIFEKKENNYDGDATYLCEFYLDNEYCFSASFYISNHDNDYLYPHESKRDKTKFWIHGDTIKQEQGYKLLKEFGHKEVYSSITGIPYYPESKDVEPIDNKPSNSVNTKDETTKTNSFFKPLINLFSPFIISNKNTRKIKP